MFDDLSFINTTQKTFKPSGKNASTPRIDEKELHTWKFQLRNSRRNMRWKLLQKGFTGKTTECFKHLHHIAIEKNILSELNRCIFQIPLKHIKLVTSKIFSLSWYYAVLIFNSKLNNSLRHAQQYKPSPPHPSKFKFLTSSTKIFLKFLAPLLPQAGWGCMS